MYGGPLCGEKVPKRGQYERDPYYMSEELKSSRFILFGFNQPDESEGAVRADTTIEENNTGVRYYRQALSSTLIVRFSCVPCMYVPYIPYITQVYIFTHTQHIKGKGNNHIESWR